MKKCLPVHCFQDFQNRKRLKKKPADSKWPVSFFKTRRYWSQLAAAVHEDGLRRKINGTGNDDTISMGYFWKNSKKIQKERWTK